MKRCWLLKTEPSVFSYDDLASKGRAGWDGVRNYQARNLLRDEFRKGDRVLVYHSNADPPCVAGVAEVVREGHPDPSQFDRRSDHCDPTSPRDFPRWFQVEVKAVRKLKHPVSLERMKRTPGLSAMPLLRKGNRLSVQPVSPEEFDLVLRLSSSPDGSAA